MFSLTDRVSKLLRKLINDPDVVRRSYRSDFSAGGGLVEPEVKETHPRYFIAIFNPLCKLLSIHENCDLKVIFFFYIITLK